LGFDNSEEFTLKAFTNFILPILQCRQLLSISVKGFTINSEVGEEDEVKGS
jgi:hypothetical protein